MSGISAKVDRYDLIDRARKIGMTDRLPNPPKQPEKHLLVGYEKRMSNWIRKLEHLERERL